jgi:hypothetical protein
MELKTLVEKVKKKLRSISLDMEKYTKFSALFRDIALIFDQCFLKANCDLWKVLNWILWHFHPDFYKKYSAVSKFSG